MMHHDAGMEDVLKALRELSNRRTAEAMPRFFKTGKGEYGEGDVFMGVAVPDVRRVARAYRQASEQLIEALLASEIHECRACALFILVDQFRRADGDGQRRIFDFYLAHTERINNWDLVDCSAQHIVGAYLADKPRDILRRLLDSPLLWDRRIAIVATWTFTRNGDYNEIFLLTDYLLAHDTKPHDLLQKACGWMLREVDRRGGRPALLAYLEPRATTLPRTMLRYAIERLPSDARHRLMQR